MINDVLAQMQGGVVVSCQPVDHGPMDRPEIVAAMAAAAVAGGAVAVRIEGLANLRAARAAVSVPIIGIVKRDLPDSPVRITPFANDVRDLITAGADIVAYDATDRPRPVPAANLLATIKAGGALAMADCSCIADGKQAAEDGADILGTTLSGYTEATATGSNNPDFDLIRAFNAFGSFTMAEGRMNTPDLVARAITAGADAVTVGTALTRLEIMTGWFRDTADAARG
jgi:N-acylglucosamine-6-phosphate 2-epimerase